MPPTPVQATRFFHPPQMPVRAHYPHAEFPLCAHRLLWFLTSSLHRHDLIYTSTNRHHVEQWVELVVRFYLYDRTKRDRRATYKLLQRHHEHVWKSAVTVFGFEQVLRSTQTPQMQAHEAQLHTCWNELTADIRAKSGVRRRTTTKTAKKTKPPRHNG